MARVLVAWELGGGMGHLTGVAALAATIAARGHAVSLAVPDPAKAKPLLQERMRPGDRVELVQGVGWRAFKEVGGTPAGKIPTLTLADVMLLFGWDDPHNIGPRVRAWEQLVERVRPDVAIADFAPTLRLATEGKLALAMMGTGYSMPPHGRLLPPIRPWHREVTAYSRKNEALALAALNRLRQALKMPAVDHFADVFHGDRSFPCTIPAFDPYRAHRQAPTLPPHNIDPIEPGPPADTRTGPALVHLPPTHRLLLPVLRALDRLGLPVELIPRGGADALPADLPAGTRVQAAYVDLSQRLPAARLAVHHGGLGIAYAAAMAATPQLLLTEKLEHRITAHALVQAGTAVMYDAETEVDGAALERDLAWLRGMEAAAAAARFGSDVPRSGGQPTLHRIADFADMPETGV
jgi:UDP:flavonoid glycosyltransferase YjiC (YdhE family)